MTNAAGVCIRLFFVVVLLAVLPGRGTAQEPAAPVWRVGAGATTPSFFVHSASFKQLPGTVQPNAASVFSSSETTTGVSAFGFFDVPLLSWGRVGLLVDYRPSVPAVLTATESLPIRLDTLVNATVQHAIDAQLQTFGIEGYTLFPLVGALGIRLGPRVDVLVSSSFEQSQDIVEPDIDFVGYEGRVVTASGALQGRASLVASVALALTYTLPLSHTGPLFLQPEIGVRYGLGTLVAGTDWSMTSIGAGLSLGYASSADKLRRSDTLFVRDTTLRLVAGLDEERVVRVDRSTTTELTETPDLTVETVTMRERFLREVPRPLPLLTAGLAIRFVLHDGTEAAEASGDIRTVEEIRHVFGSHTLAYDGSLPAAPLFGMFSRPFARAQEQAFGCSASAMQTALLQHIRQRSAALPSIVVRGSAGSDAVRSAERAVRQICADAWQVQDTALAVELRRAGAVESLVTATVGAELPAPFVVRDTVAVLPVRSVRFAPAIVSEAGIRRWSFSIKGRTATLMTQDGEGEVPAVLTWIPDERIGDEVSGEPLHCELTVEDREGQHKSVVGEVVFRQLQHRGVRHIDGSVLRFILHGREADREVLDYIQRTLQQAGATPVGISCWYSTDAPATPPVSGPEPIARALGIPPAAVELYPQVIAGAQQQARLLDETIDIRTDIVTRR